MKKRQDKEEKKKTGETYKGLHEILILAAIELLILSVISVSLKSLGGAIGFIVSYFIVYFLPGLPLYCLMKEKNIAVKLALINGYGLMIVPCLYFLIGLLITPISMFLFVAIPVIAGAIAFLIIKLFLRRNKIAKYL